jgi:hypothetical protein
MADKKVVGFKRFSDLKSSKIEEVELDGSSQEETKPALPNLPIESEKVEKPISLDGIEPESDDEDKEVTSVEDAVEKTEEKVLTYGKVAKFPKNVKASKAYNFLENVKVSKKSIWYIMVEKQDDELQMVKYNNKEGVDLNRFVNELKTYYLKKYIKETKVCKLIESIKVDGNDKYSMVKNIPLITVDGRKMISIITEDLIKLLSR